MDQNVTEDSMKTFASILDENRNIGPGFDFLRVFLAVSIVSFHAWTVTNQYFAPFDWDETPIWIIHYTLVPMFFALSGFLISGSAGRLSLKNFLINRGMRIVPALAVDTLVCAFIIGPIFTTTPLRQYFYSREFAVFFLNIIGWVHFTLPGVFTSHAVPEVNGSLWTVPFELACYAMISGLIVMGLMKNKLAVPLFVFAYLLLSVLVAYTGLATRVPWHALRAVISVGFIEHEAQAITAFLFGIIAFQLRDRIYYSPWLFVASVLVVLGIAFTFPKHGSRSKPRSTFSSDASDCVYYNLRRPHQDALTRIFPNRRLFLRNLSLSSALSADHYYLVSRSGVGSAYGPHFHPSSWITAYCWCGMALLASGGKATFGLA